MIRLSPMRPAEATVTISAPLSKSESNRLLILAALSKSLDDLHDLAPARDTRILTNLLQTGGTDYNAQDAGTSYRFLTAYLALKTTQPVHLSGTDRMHSRPIAPLVDALRILGADIQYIDKRGFPPLRISPASLDSTSDIEISGSLSSQFISALLLIGPYLNKGLRLHILPPFISRPYVDMTCALMKRNAAHITREGLSIRIEPGEYVLADRSIGVDWSSAAFLYGWALVNRQNITIPGLHEDSPQGDKRIAEIMQLVGINTEFTQAGAQLCLQNSDPQRLCLDLDCGDTPDLVPVLAVALSLCGIQTRYRNIAHLDYKESKRAQVLGDLLSPLGIEWIIDGDTIYQSGIIQRGPSLPLSSHEDHRIAMATSLLAARYTIEIEDEQVVDKSWPEYWHSIQDKCCSTEYLT